MNPKIIIRHTLTILFVITGMSLSGQQVPEFQTTLYFSDFDGNTDSVVIGYDTLGTDMGDPIFGEVNIATQPWDSIFEVRAGTLFGNVNDFNGKKQIVENACNSVYPVNIISILVKTDNGVVVTWDPQDFQEDCRDSSVIVENSQYFGYAQLQYGESYLSHEWIHATSFYVQGYIYKNYLLDIEGGGQDTVWNIYVGFVDDTNDVITSTKKVSDRLINIFPNPSSSVFNFEFPDQGALPERLLIYDVSGRLVSEVGLEGRHTAQVSCMNWAKGLYFYQIIYENGQFSRGKLVRE